MLKLFVSYATEDRVKVTPIVDRLQAEGFSPWYDQHILPGENWRLQIETNQQNADVVLIFMSGHSVSKRGFVQREANAALNKLEEMLPDDIYIVPIMLEDCDPPQRIRDRIQFIDARRPDFWEQLLGSLRKAANQRDIEPPGLKTYGALQITTKVINDSAPSGSGYEIQIEYPEFTSRHSPPAAKELSEFFEARAKQAMMAGRSAAWRGEAERYARIEYGSTRNESFSVHAFTDEILSIVYTIHTYYVGAAHGGHDFDVYNFHLGQKAVPFELSDLVDFEELKRISGLCIEKLLCKQYGEPSDRKDEIDTQWVESGAGPKWENYQKVAIGPEGLTCLFPPYQVGPYAYGSFVVDISREELQGILPTTRLSVLLGLSGAKA